MTERFHRMQAAGVTLTLDLAVGHIRSFTVEMGGRPYIGFVYVNEKHLPTRKELAYWVGLALDFNGRAKSSKGRKRKPAARKAAGAARKAAPKTAQPSRGKAGKRARRA